jgi:SPP1 family predicted phage head-tail adaptor
MRAGALSERIEIQQKAVTRADNGEEIVTWPVFATVWADVEPLSGREVVSVRAAQADLSLRVRLRYLAGVNPTMRVWWANAGWPISEVIDVRARRTELQLLCTGAAIDV